MKNNICIVIGAGDFKETTIIEYKAELSTVVAVDGGLSYCGMVGITPDIIIGDFDSADEAASASICRIEAMSPEKVLRLKPEKDDTDMLAALKWGLHAGFTEFVIYGGLGGRLDHTLANLQCLLYLKRHGAKGYLRAENTIITVLTAGVNAASETVCFPADYAGTLSLFSLERESVVSIENMKYPLSHYTVTNDFPIGVSNEFLPGVSGMVTVHTGAVVLLYTGGISV